jgi:histidinol-phosphate aminotransferase
VNVLRAREAVRTLPTYHPPLGGRNGLRLDFNENTAGCSPRVLEKLRGLNFEQLAKYPEREPVEAMVADFLQLGLAEVLLTNGVDEAIHLLCETYLEPGDEALIVVPTYSMYRIYTMTAGAQLISVPLEDRFCFSADAVTSRIAQQTRFIAIANPNNPTGTVVAREDLLQIAQSAPEAAVLIDEAYFEFYGQTMLKSWRDTPNIFVARTFSKAYGMAGLRLGVLAGDAEQMRAVRRVTSPYNVNAIALACLPEAIADQGYIARYVEEVRETRSRLESALEANGIEFWPSLANFVLARAGSSKQDVAKFVEQMRRRGILVRDRSADYACEGCVRITCGPREHADLLLTALAETCKELGAVEGASRR